MGMMIMATKRGLATYPRRCTQAKNPMQIIITEKLDKAAKKAILHIWNSEYPLSLVYKKISEFEKYLAKLENVEHYIAKVDNEIVGWLALFKRNSGRWFVMMVNSENQKTGIGSQLLNLAKEKTTEMNGWVIDINNYFRVNGQIYNSPIEFYKKNEFEITKERIEEENLSAIKVKWKR